MARKPNPSRAALRAGPAPHDGEVLDVTIVLVDGGYASTAIGPMEVLHSAGVLWNQLHGETEKPRFRVRMASVRRKSVSSLCGLELTPQYRIADIRHTDLILVSASGDIDARIAAAPALLPWLRKWHGRGALIGGICSGVAFLAEAGLLDGRRATTHWAIVDSFRARYPKVKWEPEKFITEDERIVCSGGVYAAIDLSLHLVEKFCGHEIAVKCAKSLLVSMPRSRQSGYSVSPLSRPHSDEKIREAEQYLQQYFERDLSVDMIAERASMGPRNFIRRFKAATGRLPHDYLQMLRVAAARDLLEDGATSVQAVCSQVGYVDVAFFRSLFKRHTGLTPAEYRKRFGRVNFDRGELHEVRASTQH
jgi:transcriptional regulator GlxA family with amidase domain